MILGLGQTTKVKVEKINPLNVWVYLRSFMGITTVSAVDTRLLCPSVSVQGYCTGKYIAYSFVCFFIRHDLVKLPKLLSSVRVINHIPLTAELPHVARWPCRTLFLAKLSKCHLSPVEVWRRKRPNVNSNRLHSVSEVLELRHFLSARQRQPAERLIRELRRLSD